jgi:hypothetical protein
VLKGATNFSQALEEITMDDVGAPKDKASADSNICNWHPDFSLSSPQAREWQKQNEKSRDQPLNLESDGTYKVQPGDCLSTIASRELTAAGKSVDQKSVDDEVKALIALNRDQYKELDCNKDFLQVGWNLHLPCADSAPPLPAQNCPDAQNQVEYSPRPQYERSPGYQIVAQPEYRPMPYVQWPTETMDRYYASRETYVNRERYSGYPGGPQERCWPAILGGPGIVIRSLENINARLHEDIQRRCSPKF